MVKKRDVILTLSSGATIGIVLGIFVLSFDFVTEPLPDEKPNTVSIPQKQLEIQKIWVETIAYAQCYSPPWSLDWQKSNPNAIFPHTLSEESKIIIKDYFQKEKIIIYDIIYSERPMHNQICEACGCGGMIVNLEVSNSDVDKMLSFGFTVSNWKIYEINGISIHPKNSIFKVPYKITNGVVENMVIDPNGGSILILTHVENNDTFSISIPRNLLDSKLPYGQDDAFFILVNGEETPYKETTKSTCFRNLVFEIDSDSEELEIIGSFLYAPPISKVPDECIKETMK